MSQKTWATAAVTFAMSVFSVACQSGGVGDPCVPEDEYQKFFASYAVTEVNLESRSFQCETRLCLVNHFQGRVSCPYGQKEAQAIATNIPAESEFTLCHIPGTTGAQNRIQVEVKPQVQARTAANAVYCSCRCDGPDPNARYCKCPSGFGCTKLNDPIKALGSTELAGSYCVKDNTEYVSGSTLSEACSATNTSAGPNDAPGNCGLYNGQ